MVFRVNSRYSLEEKTIATDFPSRSVHLFILEAPTYCTFNKSLILRTTMMCVLRIQKNQLSCIALNPIQYNNMIIIIGYNSKSNNNDFFKNTFYLLIPSYLPYRILYYVLYYTHHYFCGFCGLSNGLCLQLQAVSSCFQLVHLLTNNVNFNEDEQ